MLAPKPELLREEKLNLWILSLNSSKIQDIIFPFIFPIHLLYNSENIPLHLGLSDLPWEMGCLYLPHPYF